MTRISPAACLLILALTSVPLPLQAGPVDHIVAAVNDEIITASLLDATVALNQKLGKRVADRAALERETLQGLITRRLLVQEARRSRFVEIPERDVAAALDSLKRRFSASEEFDAFLKQQGLTLRELSLMMEEQMLVERFVEKKVGLFVRVTREEAERYYREQKDRFSGRQYSEVQKEIMALLTDRKIGQQLDLFLTELRSKAFIRVNSL